MKKPNIIFILVDALRAKSLGCYGYEKKISPAMDNLAQNGVLFENCFSCTTSSDPALTSLMSGLLTRSHGIIHHSFDVNDSELETFEKRKVRLLQEILKESGYQTFGLDFLGRWHSRGYDYYSPLKVDRTKRKKRLNRLSKLFKAFGLELYFKKMLSTKTFRRFSGGFHSYSKDSDRTKDALEFIAQKKEPYFLFIHFWGVHKPYTCPQVENKLSVECYDGAIKIVDDHIREIHNAAGKDTLMVILGDHGECLGEHGIYFDHHGLYDPSLQVPLIFSGSEVPSGKRVEGLVSITDVFATILSQAGINYPRKTDSRDLTSYFTQEKREIRDYIFAEENYYQDKMCIRTKQYKFIKTVGRNRCEMCDVIHGDDIQLYDLEKDPNELHNIASNENVASFEEKIEKTVHTPAGLNRKIFILVPSLDQTSPIKGAIALANGLAGNFDITFVVLRKIKTDIKLASQITLVSLESSKGFWKKYHAYKKILKQARDGTARPISISFSLPADVINVLQRRRAIIFSSLRGNIVRNYFIRWGVLGSILSSLHIFLFRFFRQILSMSQAMNKVLKSAGIKNITLIGNFVDEAYLKQFEEEKLMTGSHVRFLFLGNLTKLKQPHLLIESAKSLVSLGLHCELWFVGEGILRNSLEEMAKALGLTDQIKFFGYIPYPYHLIQQADYLVLPSLAEGISRASLEALFFGVPCIIRDVEAASELIEPSVNGYLFKDDRELLSIMSQVIHQFIPNHPKQKKCLLPSLYRYEEGIRRYAYLIESV